MRMQDHILEVIIVGLLAVIAYFLKSTKTSNDGHNENHYKHANDPDKHLTATERDSTKLEHMEIKNSILRHTEQDDTRFTAVDSKIDEVRRDAKTLLVDVAKIATKMEQILAK